MNQVLGSTVDGWRGSLDLRLEPRGGRTRLVARRQRGPLTVQRPFHPEGAPCHLYLLHPPGGVVGGDQLHIGVQVEAEAHGLLTTPGAAKFYRSAGPDADLDQALRVASGGVLEWFPQEAIVFPGAQVRARTRVDLTGDARFLGWEILCLGRPANGEAFEQGRVDFRFELWRDQTPLVLERLRVDAGWGLREAALLRGAPVTATLLVTPADEALLKLARNVLAEAAGEWLGVTLVDGVLVVRYLGAASDRARFWLEAVWGTVRPHLLGRPACTPRIWAT